MIKCRLCHAEFVKKPKAHRALYCPRCRQVKADQWRRESRARHVQLPALRKCGVCVQEIVGKRVRGSFLAPGQHFCPRCSMVLHSRLSEAEMRKVMAIRFGVSDGFYTKDVQNLVDRDATSV